MDRAQAITGEKIAAGSAVVLFLALFLPWYGVDVEGSGVSISLDDSLSAWQAMSIIDILLFGACATVIGVVAGRATGVLPPLPVTPELVLLCAGGLAVLLVLFRLLFTPDVAGFPEAFSVSPKIGIFIALLAAGGMAYGGYRSTTEV